MLLTRYIAKTIMRTFALVVLIVLSIFLSKQFIHYLSQAAAAKLSTAFMMQLLVLQILPLLTHILPLALFLAIVLGLGRLYAESEMTAMFACGFPYGRVVKVIVALTLVVAAIEVGLVHVCGPQVQQRITMWSRLAKTASVFELMQPGRFKEINDGQDVYYAQAISRDQKHFEQVFISHQPKDAQTEPFVIMARTGEVQILPDGIRWLVLKEGYRFMGKPDTQRYQILTFDTYQLRLKSLAIAKPAEEETLSTLELWRTAVSDSHRLAELQWRIHLPISVILLGLCALPLSRLNPRQSRYTRVLPALIIYLLYQNVLFVAKAKLVTHPDIKTWGFVAAHMCMGMTLLWLLKDKFRMARK